MLLIEHAERQRRFTMQLPVAELMIWSGLHRLRTAPRWRTA